MSETLFASVIVSLMTLLGVLISLRRNQEQHDRVMAEDRRKTEEERAFAVKKDAFLAAAEATTRYIGYFTSLPDRELPTGGAVADEITQLGICLNRLHFYCSLETIEQSTRLAQTLNVSTIEVIKEKIEVGFLFNEIKALESRVGLLEKQNNVIEQEIVAMIRNGPEIPLIASRRERLDKNFSELTLLHAKQSELIRAKYLAVEKCRDAVKKNLRVIYESSRDVLLMARRELNFQIDEPAYRSLMDQRITAITESLDEAFSEVRGRVKARLKL